MFPLGVLAKKALDNLTLVLLHFDGADNSNFFTDNSPNNQLVIAENGNSGVYLSTAWSKFGSSSCFFDGASFVNYLTTVGNYIGGNLGADDWQIDCFIKPLSVSGLKGIFNIFDGSTQNPINLILNNGTLTLQIDTVANPIGWEYAVTHQTPLVVNGEYHIRALRKDGFIRLFIEGVEASAPANIGTTSLVVDGGGVFQIGTAWNYIGGFPQQFHGYIDEFRIRKEAVYTGDFTPPTNPFTF